MATLPAYAELHCLSNFSFLRGASHAGELVDRAVELGYSALALTDECSLAGVVRAQALRTAGLVHAAAIVLQGRCRIVGALGGAADPKAGRGAPATGPLTLPGALTL